MCFIHFRFFHLVGTDVHTQYSHYIGLEDRVMGDAYLPLTPMDFRKDTLARNFDHDTWHIRALRALYPWIIPYSKPPVFWASYLRSTGRHCCPIVWTSWNAPNFLIYSYLLACWIRENFWKVLDGKSQQIRACSWFCSQLLVFYQAV